MNKLIVIFIAVTLAGCSANTVSPEATNIEIVLERPDSEKCKYLGEIVGSQGNWVTGDFTANADLVVGARNELRNRAYKLGGNIIYMQDMKNTNASNSLGTTNTTAIGKVYHCTDKQAPPTFTKRERFFINNPRDYSLYCIAYPDEISAEDLAICHKLKPLMMMRSPHIFE